MVRCLVCGRTEFVVPVWEDVEKFNIGEPPDHIGCTKCRFMV